MKNWLKQQLSEVADDMLEDVTGCMFAGGKPRSSAEAILTVWFFGTLVLTAVAISFQACMNGH